MRVKPSFLITIDTEGDNLWSNPKKVTTKNASYISRFQELCEKYHLKPTYLTNYEMANSPVFQKFGRDVIARKTAEVGMHLHAWDMPPEWKLTDDDSKFHPYLVEYPEEIMREKIKIMTDCLEDVFSVKMQSHRAGRWSFNEKYANLLIEFCYKIDCSVTPHISWKTHLGDPTRNGGTDYTNFPEDAYFIDQLNISRPGNSSLLEIPVSIKDANRVAKALSGNPILRKIPLFCRALNHYYPKIWVRPNGRNLNQMLWYVKNAVVTNKDYVEFMLHSSELMPGGSPRFMTELSIERLYNDMEMLFKEVSLNFEGRTLYDYYKKIIEGS